jgi:hypothetical protein
VLSRGLQRRAWTKEQTVCRARYGRIVNDQNQDTRSREPKLHEMMDCRIWKQRREQMLREVERNRRAKTLRAVRKRRHGRRSTLVWEMKRQAGRLLKFLR